LGKIDIAKLRSALPPLKSVASIFNLKISIFGGIAEKAPISAKLSHEGNGEPSSKDVLKKILFPSSETNALLGIWKKSNSL
jgi:hypothetical protein